MTSDICRLCNSRNTKLTSSINDQIISKFINLIPHLNISPNSKFPSAVCQLCLGKAKISYDFIEKIKQAQLQIEKNFKRSPKKSLSNATENALKKVQLNAGIKISRVAATKPKVDLFESELLDEVEYDPMDYDGDNVDDEDFKPDNESEVDVEEIESEEEYVQELESSDDDDYKPTSKKGAKRSSTKDPDENVREIIIDAPITFTCSKCDIKYSDLESLTAHMKSKTCFTKITPTCGECGKIFSSKKNLSAHSKTHQHRDKVICEMCAKAFNYQHDLRAHMESVHRRVERKDCIYKCFHCEESFTSQMDLLEHVKEHRRLKKEAPRMCEFCGKECKNLKSYQSHLIIHKEIKPHACNLCGKGFSKQFLLVQHMHIHTGIKAYSCDLCEKSYAKRDSLRTHKKRDHANCITGN